MIKFLFKGIMRDKSRSILPIIIIMIGVALTVLLSGYIKGVFGDVVDQNARFDTGHVKVMTKAYDENKDQMPNDLALLGVADIIADLEVQYPEMSWVQRMRFGGLIDVPDEDGETKGQGPAAGLGLDLLSGDPSEIERYNLQSSIITGTLPSQNGEALIAHDFAEKLAINIGDEVTYFGTTMNGSMTFHNFKVAGTVHFGSSALDRGAIIVDITDAQLMLDMYDGASEILGFFPQELYDNEKATAMSASYNALFADSDDEFAPIMYSLKQQNNLASLLDYADYMSTIFVVIFIFTMSIVLWNTGLLSGLRRYKEYGIRLALGEAKGTIYKTMILEAVLIGFIGSVIGTTIGILLTYYLQVVGIDISGMTDGTGGIMLPNVMRAKVSPNLFFIGFIPGLFAMVLGNMLSGIGIFKRETATLFKELEV